MQPLKGLTVLDFSTLLPGPLASLLLAEAGARVVKVERPGSGDEMRHYPPLLDGHSVLFAMLNRGKESLAVDLKSAEDRTRLAGWLGRADILIEQFRPGVMARLGLDYETLSARYPRLIYCSVTGFGQSGPRAQVAGHDLNYVADTGLLSLAMGPPEAPVVPPALIADIAGGAYPAVMNILLALLSRAGTGKGAHLDISMTDNLFPLMWWALGQVAATGEAPGNADDLLTGGTARYRLYPTSDGETLAAAPIEDRFWRTFCEVIGLDASLRDDAADPPATVRGVAKIIASRTAEEWRAAFAGVDACAVIVRDLTAALSDPHYRARGLHDRATRLPGGQDIAALPVPVVSAFREHPSETSAAPALGSLSGNQA